MAHTHVFAPALPHSTVRISSQCEEILRNFNTEASHPSDVLVHWEFPSFGFIKLNTDGAARGAPGAAGCGGLFRNYHGAWLGGFSYRVGICNAFSAELWGIWHGLNHAWHKGWRRLVLESDSTSVVALLTRQGAAARESRLLTRIRALLRQNWQVVIVHAYHEANFCADFLATLPLNDHALPDDSWFMDPPYAL